MSHKKTAMRIWFLLWLLATAPAAAADLKAEMQALEQTRGAAIAADDEATLDRIYAPDFAGVTAGGAQVTRDDLFAIFKRAHEHGALAAESTILTAREIAGAVVVTGHLRLLAPGTKQVVSESFYIHVFRKDAGGWRMAAGAATPAAAP